MITKEQMVIIFMFMAGYHPGISETVSLCATALGYTRKEFGALLVLAYVRENADAGYLGVSFLSD